MQKTKSKNESSLTTNRMPFIVLWILGFGLVSHFTSVFPLLAVFEGLTPEIRSTIHNASLVLRAILGGLIQIQFVERLLKHSMRGWMLYTIPGAFMNLLAREFVPTVMITGIIAAGFVAENSLAAAEVRRTISGIAANFPVAILQALWLHQRVKRAWLWPVLTFVLLLISPYTNLVFYLLLGSNGGTINYILVYGGLQGLLMYELWRHPKQAEKAKVDFATQRDQGRPDRLQETGDADDLTTSASEERQALRKRL
jgi:hypothetical protein